MQDEINNYGKTAKTVLSSQNDDWKDNRNDEAEDNESMIEDTPAIKTNKEVMREITDNFKIVLELEGILAPKEDQYDSLIQNFEGAIYHAEDIQAALPKDDCEFFNICDNFLQELIESLKLQRERWIRLQQKSQLVREYKWSENSKDAKAIHKAQDRRGLWGGKLNQYNYLLR